MSTELAGVLFFLGFSVLFYVLFGGADHGAGMVELIVGRKSAKEQRQVISQAMAPVWEANHVWLILAVVILFMGFPRVYTLISTYLYLPILAMLIGIVGRGCAFTFRHYDSLGSRYHKIYSKVFSLASLWTSLFLGIIAGAMMLGRIKLDASTASEAYLDPLVESFFIIGRHLRVHPVSFFSLGILGGRSRRYEDCRIVSQKSSTY